MDERDPCTEGALLIELQLRGLKVEQQVRYPVSYKGKQVGNYVADLVVEDTVVVELKCVECLAAVHTAQRIHHLRASGLKVEWKRFRL